jgi:kynurenine 3-monooxygenase
MVSLFPSPNRKKKEADAVVPNDNVDDATTHVVISGAGPAGLLLSLLLLQRNEQKGTKYKVTLLDGRPDLGKLDPATELTKHRSWMLGLAGHGLQALREIPDLYRDYVNGVGIRLRSVSIFLGSKQMKTQVGDEGDDIEGYIVDRNYVCAAISRYMNDKHGSNPYLSMQYGTKLMYVDSEYQRVLVRTDGGMEQYTPYDLLVGADGIRSVVREAIVKHHFDFEYDVGDIFQCFKAVHVQRPPSLDMDAMHLLPGSLPSMNGIALPETGDQLNISIGANRNIFDELPDEIKSDDPKVVAEYFKKNFKAFALVDYDDFGRQWASQRWNRTGQVHCNFYHSTPLKIVLMGDAAHATSPTIGMGMNTALRDAQALYNLLDQHDDDLEIVLPAYSKARVKEGNSLTDLALHLYCMDNFHQIIETLHLVVRSKLASMFPTFVTQHPQSIIGNPKFNLCDVYESAVQLGIMDKHRRINNQIRLEHFERFTGMVKGKRTGSWSATIAAMSVIVGVIIVWSSKRLAD